MTSQARWMTFTSAVVGSSSAGTMLRPSTTVLVPGRGSDRIEARPGIGMPPVTVPLLLRWPNSVSGTSLVVWGTISMAANFTGWLMYTHRASESPTPIWTGSRSRRRRTR